MSPFRACHRAKAVEALTAGIAVAFHVWDCVICGAHTERREALLDSIVPARSAKT